MPDKSTPSPSDPESEDKGLPPIPDPEDQPSDEVRPRLKLNRLVVKDIKINPHVNPDAEPVPKAESFSEPDPEPPVIPETPREVVAPSIEPVAPPQEEPEVEEEQATPAVEDTEDPVEADKEAPPAKKSRKGRKLIFPIILIVGSILYGVHIIWDPLGWKGPENEPANLPPDTETSQSSEELVGAEESKLAISNVLSDGSAPSIEDYLEKISQQELKLSSAPRGVFINSVFYSEGMPLNPSLGLTIESIPDDTGENLIIFDTEGNAYQIDIP